MRSSLSFWIVYFRESSKRIVIKLKNKETKRVLSQVVFTLFFTQSKPVPLFPSHSFIPIPNSPLPSASSADTHTTSCVHNSESSFVWRPLLCCSTLFFAQYSIPQFLHFSTVYVFPRWLTLKATKNCDTCLLHINISICYCFLLRIYTNVYFGHYMKNGAQRRLFSKEEFISL
jgi:hypothetical protein